VSIIVVTPYSTVSLRVKKYRDNIVDTFIIVSTTITTFCSDALLHIKEYRDDVVGDVAADVER
jgi:hypothetical protein